MVVPNISLKALISALINVKSDFISVESVGIIVLPVGEGDGEDFVRITGVGLTSGSLLILVNTKKVKPKLIKQRKKIIIKTLAYLSIIICYYKYSIILVAKYMKNPFIISGLFFLFSIIFLFVFFNKTSRDLLVEQIQHRQQVSVRAGSRSVETLLNSIGNSLVTLSNNPTQSNLDQFIKLWSKSEVVGVILINSNGIVTNISNITDIKDTGTNVSDRDYFKWAKDAKKGEFLVFPPRISKVGASKNKYALPIVTPVFSKEGKFNGAISVSILLSDVTVSYLDNLKVLDSSKVYLVAGNGEIIYSDYFELVGKNVKSIFENYFLGKERIIEIINENLKSDEESKLKLAIPNFQNKFILEPYLISTAPIHISDQLWKVVVVTPETSLVAFTYKIFKNQILAVFIIATLLIIITLRIAKNIGYQEAVKAEHKLHKINS